MKRLSGGNGTRPLTIGLMHGGAVLNDTNEAYEIAYSYDTVASGRADEIVFAPGEVACRISKGGPRDFAVWEIGTLEEHVMKGREIHSLVHILRMY